MTENGLAGGGKHARQHEEPAGGWKGTVLSALGQALGWRGKGGGGSGEGLESSQGRAKIVSLAGTNKNE